MSRVQVSGNRSPLGLIAALLAGLLLISMIAAGGIDAPPTPTPVAELVLPTASATTQPSIPRPTKRPTYTPALPAAPQTAEEYWLVTERITNHMELRLIEPASGAVVHTFGTAPFFITLLHAHSLFVYDGSFVRYIDLPTLQEHWTVAVDSSMFMQHLWVTADGTQLITSVQERFSLSRTHVIQRYDLASGTFLRQHTVDLPTAYDLVGTVDGSQLIVHLPSGLAAYDLASNSVELILPNEATRGLLKVVLAPDGSAIYGLDTAGMLWHLDAQSYAVVAQVDLQVQLVSMYENVDLVVSPDSAAVALWLRSHALNAQANPREVFEPEHLILYDPQTSSVTTTSIPLQLLSAQLYWKDSSTLYIVDDQFLQWDHAQQVLYLGAEYNVLPYTFRAAIPAFDLPAVVPAAFAVPNSIIATPTLETTTIITGAESTPLLWLAASDGSSYNGAPIVALAADGTSTVVHNHALALLHRHDLPPLIFAHNPQQLTELAIFDPVTSQTRTLPIKPSDLALTNL